MLPYGCPASQGGSEVVPPATDSQIFEVLADFNLAPFMFLRRGEFLHFAPAEIYYKDHRLKLDGYRWVHLPCGYYPLDDVEAATDEAERDRLVAKGYLREVSR